MKTAVRQVAPWEHFPSGNGRVLAVLRATPTQLTESTGLQFENGEDDLDSYVLAAINDPSVGQFWLWRYAGSPDRGTEVWFDEPTTSGTAVAVLQRQLGAIARDLTWIAEDHVTPQQ